MNAIYDEALATQLHTLYAGVKDSLCLDTVVYKPIAIRESTEAQSLLPPIGYYDQLKLTVCLDK